MSSNLCFLKQPLSLGTFGWLTLGVQLIWQSLKFKFCSISISLIKMARKKHRSGLIWLEAERIRCILPLSCKGLQSLLAYGEVTGKSGVQRCQYLETEV